MFIVLQKNVVQFNLGCSGGAGRLVEEDFVSVLAVVMGLGRGGPAELGRRRCYSVGRELWWWSADGEELRRESWSILV